MWQPVQAMGEGTATSFEDQAPQDHRAASPHAAARREPGPDQDARRSRRLRKDDPRPAVARRQAGGLVHGHAGVGRRRRAGGGAIGSGVACGSGSRRRCCYPPSNKRRPRRPTPPCSDACQRPRELATDRLARARGLPPCQRTTSRGSHRNTRPRDATTCLPPGSPSARLGFFATNPLRRDLRALSARSRHERPGSTRTPPRARRRNSAVGHGARLAGGSSPRVSVEFTASGRIDRGASVPILCR